MTIAERLRLKGVEQGIQQGIQQGRLATLRRQLELRFGTLDAELAAHLDAADAAALDRLTERVVTAATIDAVFAE